MNFECLNESLLNKNSQNELTKLAKHLVSKLKNNNDSNSWDNFSSLATNVTMKYLEKGEIESGFLLCQIINQLTCHIQNNPNSFIIPEFQNLQENGKLLKEGKDLLLQTIVKEQQERLPMNAIQSVNFMKMLTDVSEQYDKSKILTIEWVVH
jgi:hypothetical protein